MMKIVIKSISIVLIILLVLHAIGIRVNPYMIEEIFDRIFDIIKMIVDIVKGVVNGIGGIFKSFNIMKLLYGET